MNAPFANHRHAIHAIDCGCQRCAPPGPAGHPAKRRAWALLGGMGAAVILITVIATGLGLPGIGIVFGLQ